MRLCQDQNKTMTVKIRPTDNQTPVRCRQSGERGVLHEVMPGCVKDENSMQNIKLHPLVRQSHTLMQITVKTHRKRYAHEYFCPDRVPFERDHISQHLSARNAEKSAFRQLRK